MQPKRARIGFRQKGKRKMPLLRIARRLRQYPSFGTHGFNMEKAEAQYGSIKPVKTSHYGHYFVSNKVLAKKMTPRQWFDALRASLETNLGASMSRMSYDSITKTLIFGKHKPLLSLVIGKEGIILQGQESHAFSAHSASKYHGTRKQRHNELSFPLLHDPFAPDVHQIFLSIGDKELEQINIKWKKNWNEWISKGGTSEYERLSAAMFFQNKAIELFVKKILTELEKHSPERKPIKPK